MDDWYRYYRAEIDRRGDEIKVAEKHRLLKLAQNDPYTPAALKLFQRLFSSLRTWLSHRDAPKKDQASVLRKIYGNERL